MRSKVYFWGLIILGILSSVYGAFVKLNTVGSYFYLFWILLTVILFYLAYAYKKKKFLYLDSRIKKLISLFVVSMIFLFVFVQINIISKYDNKIEEEVDYLLVLGATSPKNRPSQTLKMRLDKAYEYLSSTNAKCIVSGQGRGDSLSEAQIMADYLVEKGIEKFRIIIEDKAGNTKENVIFSRRLIPPKSKVGILTSDFHVFRAAYIADREGLRGVKSMTSPSPKSLQLNNLTREFFALFKYLVFS